MTKETLKKEIIDWLSSLDDKATLEYLKVVKDTESQTSDWWNDLTNEQKTKIHAGLKDLKEGNVISHQEVKSKYGL